MTDPTLDQRETHNHGFTGWWIPREMVEMLLNGELTANEMILVSMVHSLAKRNGCFASCRYLGENLNITPRHVKRMLAKLEGLGIIQRKLLNENTRVMKTTFNDIKCWRRKPLRRDALHAIGGMPPRASGDAPQGIAIPSKEGTIEKNITQSTRAKRPLDGGFLGDPAKRKTFYQKCSSKLERALREKRKFEPISKTAKWPSVFEKLCHAPQMDRARVKRVLVWYMEHIGEPYIPRAYSAKAFAENFVRIESAMERRHEKAKLEPSVLRAESLEGEMAQVWSSSGVQDMGWPASCLPELPGLWSESWTALEEAVFKAKRLQRRLAKWGEENEKLWKPSRYHDNRRVHDFISRLFNGPLAQPGSALPRYMADVARSVSKWSSWSGSTKALTWALENKRVQTILRQESVAECGDDTVLRLFMDQMGTLS